jgi:hypothetical protein
VVNFYDGSIEEYRREIESQNAQERMRNERIWNRGQFLDFLEAFILSAVTRYDREKVTPREYATMHDYCLAYVKANMSELYDEYPWNAGRDLWWSVLPSPAATITYDHGHCIHVEVKWARSQRAAASLSAHCARKHYGTRVMHVSPAGSCHANGMIDYTYVYVSNVGD